MGKFIGSKVVKAVKKIETYTPKVSEKNPTPVPVESVVYGSSFVDAGNRSLLVNVVKAYDSAGNEIDLKKVESFDVKIVSFENNQSRM